MNFLGAPPSAPTSRTNDISRITCNPKIGEGARGHEQGWGRPGIFYLKFKANLKMVFLKVILI